MTSDGERVVLCLSPIVVNSTRTVRHSRETVKSLYVPHSTPFPSGPAPERPSGHSLLPSDPSIRLDLHHSFRPKTCMKLPLRLAYTLRDPLVVPSFSTQFVLKSKPTGS